jgi:hypothetical protein
MIMTGMTRPGMAALAERYVAVWDEPAAAARRAAAAQLRMPDATDTVQPLEA